MEQTGRKYGPDVSIQMSGKSRYSGERPRDENGRMTLRRYGKTTQAQEERDRDEEIIDIRSVKLSDMKDNEIRMYAMQNFGRRFHEEEKSVYVRDETQKLIENHQYGRGYA